MLKKILEVEGRGTALSSVFFRRKIRWVGTSNLNHAEVTHRIRLTRPNIIAAFSQGKNARLQAEVVASTAKGKYKGQRNTILLDGSIADGAYV